MKVKSTDRSAAARRQISGQPRDPATGRLLPRNPAPPPGDPVPDPAPAPAAEPAPPPDFPTARRMWSRLRRRAAR